MRCFATCILMLLIASLPQMLMGQVTPQPPAKDSVKSFEVIKGPSMRMIQTDTGTLQIIAGGAIVYQEKTKFFADSMVFNTDTRILESFGNVHINDGDTVNIYSQYLLYNGMAKFAHLKKNVRLIGKTGTLFADELDYNMSSGIANYYHNGKIINKKNIITSQNGTYYADTRDVYFKKDVKMDGPKDHIRADSLIYNMNDGNITFVSPTFLWNPEVQIRTTEGRYNTNNGDAFFSARTNVKDSSNRIYEANNMALEGKTGNAQLEGNAVIIDSANGFSLIANQVFMNNQNNSFLATRKPLLIVKEKGDSTYIAADTIFTGTGKMINDEIVYPSDTATALNKQQSDLIGKINADSIINHRKLLPQTGKHLIPDSLGALKAAGDTTIPSIEKKVTETGDSILQQTNPDSLHISPPDNLLKKDTTTVTGAATNPPEIPEKNKIAVDTVRNSVSDSLSRTLNESTDSASQKKMEVKISNRGISALHTVSDTTAKPKDTTRYFIAYHNVRIFNDSLQSVCDSLFISSRDSVFRLYRSPIVWNGRSQVTGDTMFLFTKNKAADRLFAFNHAFIVNQTTEGFFNQIEGKTLNAKFRDNKFDSVRIRGSQAETVYYIQEEDSSYYGIERGSSDVIQMYFKNGELQKIPLINQVKGKIYPMWAMPEDQKRLKGFDWQESRRPKSKTELFF